MTDRWTDDQLVEDLARGLEQVDPVPTEVTEFAKAAFAWRSIDAELAELVYDSSQEELTVVRSEAPARQLTFRAPGVEIEVVMMAGEARRLIGQLVPPQQAMVELRFKDEVRSVESDHLGRFTFHELPVGPISIRCITEDSVVQTDWMIV
jgi:hypothetical protein